MVGGGSAAGLKLGQNRIRGHGIPPLAPVFGMTVGETTPCRAFKECSFERGERRREVLDRELVAIEEHSSGTQDSSQFSVRGSQLRLGEPVQRGRAHGGVRLAVETKGGMPTWRSQVEIEEPKTWLVVVARSSEGEQQRIGVNCDDGSRREAIEQARCQ
jgi:hypothetical protein